MVIRPIQWRNGTLRIIDQTRLPGARVEISLDSADTVWEAIKGLRVRGAPAIGVCAAFGLVVGVRERTPRSASEAVAAAHAVADYLATSRPTAVNLFWALDRLRRVAEAHAQSNGAATVLDALTAEAEAIMAEDEELCRAIGGHGAELIQDGMGLLTHCNAGALATSSYGTALAPMFRAHELGRQFHVFADETRPLLQGARLTVWELMQAGIDCTLICDNTAAQVMRQGKVQLVIVGADRIASNGDVANKIGTYTVALAARAHDVPFYVAAPSSTFDLNIASGAEIPIEERDPAEVTHGFGVQTAPDGVKVYSPAFDVTPAAFITGIITDRGILRPPCTEVITAVMGTNGN